MTPAYGRKGGDGPTKNRKAETIIADIAGQRFSKRVFFGQRFIAVGQGEEDYQLGRKPMVSAWSTKDQAERMSERYRHAGCEFHAWAQARAAA